MAHTPKKKMVKILLSKYVYLITIMFKLTLFAYFEFI